MFRPSSSEVDSGNFHKIPALANPEHVPTMLKGSGLRKFPQNSCFGQFPTRSSYALGKWSQEISTKFLLWPILNMLPPCSREVDSGNFHKIPALANPEHVPTKLKGSRLRKFPQDSCFGQS